MTVTMKQPILTATEIEQANENWRPDPEQERFFARMRDVLCGPLIDVSFRILKEIDRAPSRKGAYAPQDTAPEEGEEKP